MVILAIIFILLNAFFVLSEFSLVKVRKSRLEELIKEKKPNAQLAFEMSNKLDTYLSATQLGITQMCIRDSIDTYLYAYIVSDLGVKVT